MPGLQLDKNQLSTCTSLKSMGLNIFAYRILYFTRRRAIVMYLLCFCMLLSFTEATQDAFPTKSVAGPEKSPSFLQEDFQIVQNGQDRTPRATQVVSAQSVAALYL